VVVSIIIIRVLIASSVTLSLYATDAFAADATCKSQAAEKKLAGAAMTSFMKCEKDARASCDTSAADQKLAGAAKTSFTKK
jgi:hypothetical protein